MLVVAESSFEFVSEGVFCFPCFLDSLVGSELLELHLQILDDLVVICVSLELLVLDVHESLNVIFVIFYTTLPVELHIVGEEHRVDLFHYFWSSDESLLDKHKC